MGEQQLIVFAQALAGRRRKVGGRRSAVGGLRFVCYLCSGSKITIQIKIK
jgi:hypothetical protein